MDVCPACGALPIDQTKHQSAAMVCYRPAGLGFIEVARVNDDGSVRIFEPNGLGDLKKDDLVTLVICLAKKTGAIA